MLGEDVAIDGSIRSKSFRGFYRVCNSGWLPTFELRVERQLRVVTHLVEEWTLCWLVSLRVEVEAM
jgi:hypothetical protein